MNADEFGLPISACICVYLRFNFHCYGPIRTYKGNSVFSGRNKSKGAKVEESKRAPTVSVSPVCP